MAFFSLMATYRILSPLVFICLMFLLYKYKSVKGKLVGSSTLRIVYCLGGMAGYDWILNCGVVEVWSLEEKKLIASSQL